VCVVNTTHRHTF